MESLGSELTADAPLDVDLTSDDGDDDDSDLRMYSAIHTECSELNLYCNINNVI